jgi:hypothetical protein
MIRAAFLALVIAAVPGLAEAQGAKKPASRTTATKTSSTKKAPPPMKTTLSGVYTLEEAVAGKELFAGLCTSCHPIATHSTGEFRRKWQGRPLSELFIYMRTLMPKNDPGSLADEDYAVALAYLLQANRMPAGKTYLSTDTLELRKIRIDTVRAVGKK